LFSKPLVAGARMGALTVTGCAYLVAAGLMLLVQLWLASSPTFLALACSDCEPTWEGAWTMPGSDALLALLYFIFFQSVLAYGLLTWGNKHAPPSAVLGYTSLQPLAAVLLTLLLVATGYNRRHPRPAERLRVPGWSLLGIAGIFVGLAVVVRAQSVEIRMGHPRTQPAEYTALVEDDAVELCGSDGRASQEMDDALPPPHSSASHAKLLSSGKSKQKL
jgi:drug/metabolite transporter (DMT)-like permease